MGSSGLRCRSSLASTALSSGGSSRTWRHGATMMRTSSTHREHGHDHEDGGRELDGEGGVHPLHYRPRAKLYAVIRATTLGGAPGSGDGQLKRRVVIRRIVSILALDRVGHRDRRRSASTREVFGGLPAARHRLAVPVGTRRRRRSRSSASTPRRSTPRASGYPLPRDKVAQLVDNLKAAGAKVIVFDVIYRSTRRTTPGRRRRCATPSIAPAT